MFPTSLCRPCRTLAGVAFNTRAFGTSQAVLARANKFNKNQNVIRVKSKKALAAKAKRQAALVAKEVEKAEKLPLMEAIAVLRAVEVASPKSMYELYVKTEMRNGVAVPKGRFKLPREANSKNEETILVFAEGKLAEEAKRAGAHIVGGLELIDGIVNNKIRATTILSTTAFIRPITPKLGRVLGPQGLMPSERRGTVTDDIGAYIRKLGDTSEWRADKAGNIHMPIAQIHFPITDVVKNFEHFMKSVKEATGNIKDTRRDKERDNKPVTLISKVVLSSRQGPGIRIANY